MKAYCEMRDVSEFIDALPDGGEYALVASETRRRRSVSAAPETLCVVSPVRHERFRSSGSSVAAVTRRPSSLRGPLCRCSSPSAVDANRQLRVIGAIAPDVGRTGRSVCAVKFAQLGREDDPAPYRWTVLT